MVIMREHPIIVALITRVIARRFMRRTGAARARATTAAEATVSACFDVAACKIGEGEAAIRSAALALFGIVHVAEAILRDAFTPTAVMLTRIAHESDQRGITMVQAYRKGCGLSLLPSVGRA